MSKIITEFKLHCKLLKVQKGGVRKYLSSPYRLILIVVFCGLFLPHAFVVVKDISFVTAYEVDPGSIISSIISLYKNFYNMNAGYHSKYYGWTYYWISFIVLAPIYLIEEVLLSGNYTAFFIGVRFLFFLIGLFSVLAFYEIISRVFRNKLVGLFGGLIYISSSVITKYFYFLHPESTGLLFLFLGILCLFKFKDSKGEEYRWYTIGLLCVTLSTLSKHPFLIPAVAVLLLFGVTYTYFKKISFFKFLFSWQFVKILLFTVVFSFFIFFVINPHAFLEPKIFLTYQLSLTSNQVTKTSLTFFDGVKAWVKIIQLRPIILLSIVFAPITIIISLVSVKDKLEKIYYLFNLLTGILFIVTFTILSRFIIDQMYFAPIYPLFIINFLSIPMFISRNWKNEWITSFFKALFIVLTTLIIIKNACVSLPAAYKRLDYKATTIYQVFHYIEEEIPDGSKIAYDHYVALPSTKELEGCHYWRGCGTDYIEEFNPDYVIFNMEWTFGGEVHYATQRLIDYIEDHDMILVDIIGDESTDQVWIWEKPDLLISPDND